MTDAAVPNSSLSSSLSDVNEATNETDSQLPVITPRLIKETNESSATSVPMMEEEQCKHTAKEYFLLSKQINDLTRRRTELAKQLIPSMEHIGHTSYRLASEGGQHIVAVQKTNRPKPFTKSYLSKQINQFLKDDGKASELLAYLCDHREQVADTRLVIK